MSALPAPVEPNEIAHPLTLDERRDRIMAVLERTALDIGEELIAAKDEHPGGFVAWVEKSLPFGLDKAERLMAITRCFADADEGVRAFLPPAWSALYELTRLAPERLAIAIEARVVNPDMTVAEAKLLARKESSGEPPTPRPTPPTTPPVPHPQKRLSCDIVARELMRYSRVEMSDEVASMMKSWMHGRGKDED